MATISDYLEWRGDVTMDYAPFNEVDNYIISKIGSPDFTGIVPADTTTIKIGDAVDLYNIKCGGAGSYLGALASPHIMEVIQMLPKTARFMDLRLSGFVKKCSEAETEQFSAITATLPDGRHYVAYRGTDDTVLAWKEDLMMSVEESVAAQRDALDYLTWVADNYEGELIVGGHSKGGNLAVYAASCARPDIQNRISAVFNNDGPGFRPQFYINSDYLKIAGRIYTFLPRHSLVGTLLQQVNDVIIVNDSCRGAGAHDGFTWEVRRCEFVRSPGGLSRSSRSFDEAMNGMIATMTIEERKNVIDEISEIIASTGSETITEIAEKKWRQALTMAKSFKNSPETRKFVTTIAELLVKDYRERLQIDKAGDKKDKAERKQAGKNS